MDSSPKPVFLFCRCRKCQTVVTVLAIKHSIGASLRIGVFGGVPWPNPEALRTLNRKFMSPRLDLGMHPHVPHPFYLAVSLCGNMHYVCVTADGGHAMCAWKEGCQAVLDQGPPNQDLEGKPHDEGGCEGWLELWGHKGNEVCDVK